MHTLENCANLDVLQSKIGELSQQIERVNARLWKAILEGNKIGQKWLRAEREKLESRRVDLFDELDALLS